MRRIGAVSVDGEMVNFLVMSRGFGGAVAKSVLYYTGLRAARDLYNNDVKPLLKKHEVSFSGAPLDRAGKRMVSFSITRSGKSVIVRSYPMNVYRAKGETGPRTAKRTAGEKIFRSFESEFPAEFVAGDVLQDIMANVITDEPPKYRIKGKWPGWQTDLKSLRKTPGTGGKIV
jgi:hypothetical protein